MRFGGGKKFLSYYRFRNADPSIIINKFDNYKEENDKELILLNKNFRSSPEIINAVNSIFKKIMSRQVGEIIYDEDAYLTAAREDHTAKPEIHLLEKTDENKAVNDDVVQAHFIAHKIKELVKNKEADYKDIGILYRSINPRAKAVIRAFDEEGIPVIFEGEAEITEAFEVHLFLELLKLIDNHKQDYSLLSVMHLPIFNFSLDDDIKIRSKFKDKVYFFQAVESYRDEVDDELSDRLKSFYEDLKTWRELSKQLDMEDFLWQLLLDSGFYSFAGSLPGGNERKRNLRTLLERAKSFKSTYLKGISSFLQYVNELGKKGQTVTGRSVSADNANAVRIMTIHKSKGLEFPVLFLADAGRQFKNETSTDFLTHMDYGYGGRLLELKDDILIKRDLLLTDCFKIVKKRERYSELIRILYVALTRAQNRLFVVGITKEKEKAEKNWKNGTLPGIILKERSFLDWIMSALYNQESESFSNLNWKVCWNDYKDFIELSTETSEEPVIHDKSYEKLKDLLYKQLDQPVKEQENENPLKMSVSRIKHYGIETQEEIDLEPLEINKKKIASPAMVGSAVHSLLQFIDLKAYQNEKDKERFLDLQKDVLVKKGLIDEEVAKSVESSIIIDFLKTSLGQRLIDSNEEDVLKEVSFALDLKPDDLKDTLPEIGRTLEVSGIIDCCFIEDGQWILLDYKTDRKYNETDWKKRINEYTLQISLYALALERLTGIGVKEKHLCFLSERKNYIV